MSRGVINFRVAGGKKLSGEITTNTSKNSAVCLLQASLLNEGKTVLRDVPNIEEVKRIIEILKELGVKVKRLNEKDIELKAGELHPQNIKANHTRSVILLLGPLVHLFPKFNLPQPDGCKLGSRTVRPHLYALEKLGVRIKTKHDHYEISRGRLKPAKIVLYESGDTATENALMAASKIEGETTIKFASANYQIQDLCGFLKKLGVEIEGVGTTTLVVRGKRHLRKDIEYAVSEDPIESMLFLSIAAVTGSAITVKRCPIEFLELELLKLEKMGLRFEIGPVYKSRNGQIDLADITIRPSKLRALEEKIYARPFPGLNIDNLPFFVPIATQARGETLIHDWVYENRAIYYTELAKLGANISLADPHRVYVKGPTALRANEIVAPPALRPAAIILIAMLAAKGVSILRNVYSINRGYEDLAKRLNKLGADIKIIK